MTLALLLFGFGLPLRAQNPAAIPTALARFSREAPACRLSITEYVGNTLLLEPRPPRGGAKD